MSDNEKLLKALVEDTDVNDFVPNTRFETMLKACCCGEDCELEPKTRNEYLLKQLQEKLKGGTGGDNINIMKTLIDGKKSAEYLFEKYQGESVEGLISYDDTENATNTRYMFRYCSSLVSVPPLNTNKSTNMTSMFNGCSNLKTIDISKLASSSGSFANSCYSLTKLIIRTMDTIPTFGSSMFTNCNHFTGTVSGQFNPDGLKDGRIYVPDDKVEELKATTGWSDFADIIVPLSTLEE